ncbi:hypothetical protein [Halorarius litoreus]|uniref:DUF7861 family protein n=1 Tax=Halorarius litoreus TaxID=2962676 RepID=UPI0020CC13E8|nr:hypothetical protein [Halorarius litoreus]
MHDRLRAKPPTTDTEAWTEATVLTVDQTQSGHVVTVDGPDGVVEVTLEGALFDLFSSRVDGDVVGSPCWYR